MTTEEPMDIDHYTDYAAGPPHDPLLVQAYLNTPLARVRSGRLRGDKLRGLEALLQELGYEQEIADD